MNWLGSIIQEYVGEKETVLDLGCGVMGASDDLKCKSILGCDIFPAYLDKIKTLWPTIRLGMDELDRFMDKSYDVIICLDVVEHLDKDLALKVLDECKRICRNKAIIFTPSEFNENKQPDEGAWGLGENPHQLHKCVLSKNDFRSRGYLIRMCNDAMIGVYG